MRIAFLGKGGSGKTTLSTLFSLYADSKDYRVGLLDVDVNSHTAQLVGAPTVPSLSSPDAQHAIMKYLAGTNKRIKIHEMLNTTPPGTGSGRWTLDEDSFITESYGAPFGKQARVFTLGSYKAGDIGSGCHHSTQHIAENMLSHFSTQQGDILVIDSVAGNDSFANTLYYQDMLVFIVKPEREGITVFQRYYDLAKEAGIADRVRVIANQVMNDMQRAFLQRELPKGVLIGEYALDESIMAARLEDKPLTIDMISADLKDVFDMVLKFAQDYKHSDSDYYNFFCGLHRRVSSKAWVHGAYREGLEDQIDPEYQP